MKYARQCSVTGEGMNEGWVWFDGMFYTKYEKDTLAECRKDREAILSEIDELIPTLLIHNDVQDIERWNELEDAISRAEEGKETDEDLLLIAYQQDYLYYTEWECEEDFQYEEINGKLIEIQ